MISIPKIFPNMLSALNFFSSYFTFDDSKRWALEWLLENDPETAKKVEKLDAYKFSNRGFVCKIIMNNVRVGDMDADLPNRLIRFFEELPVLNDTNSKTHNKPKEAQEPMNNVIYQLEDVVDAILAYTENTHIPEVVVPVDVNMLKKARTWIEKELAESQDMIAKYQKIIDNLQSVYQRCGGIIETTKKQKEMQKTMKQEKQGKIMSTIAMLKNFRYQKKDVVSGVESIGPMKIVGAKKLLTFNTETRTATLFLAKDSTGLTIRGSSIRNYDEQNSYSVKIRKPELFLASPSFIAALKEQKTKQSMARGLTSDNTLLLTV